MLRSGIVAICMLPSCVMGQQVASSYATRDGRAAAVVITCPNQDGSYTAGACSFGGRPAPVGYAAPNSAAVTVANMAVTVFAAGSVASGCDIINTANTPLYIDFTTIAVVGSATAIPLQPGQAYHCAYAPSGAVTAVATQAQSFVAIRY